MTRTSPVTNKAIANSRPTATGQSSHLSIGSDASSDRCRSSNPHCEPITEHQKAVHSIETIGEQSKGDSYVIASSPNNTNETGINIPLTSMPLSQGSMTHRSVQNCPSYSRCKEATNHTTHNAASMEPQPYLSDSRSTPATSDYRHSSSMSTLNNLIGALEVRESDDSSVVSPLNTGYAFGEDALPSFSKTDISREKASSGRVITLGFLNQAKEYTFKANEGSNQDRVDTKLASKSQTSSTHLRCPYYFNGDAHPCQFHQRFPRDIR